MKPIVLKSRTMLRTQAYRGRSQGNKRVRRAHQITSPTAPPLPTPPPFEPPVITPNTGTPPPVRKDLPNLPPAHRALWFIDPHGLAMAFQCPLFSCSVSTSPIIVAMVLYALGYSPVVAFIQAISRGF